MERIRPLGLSCAARIIGGRVQGGRSLNQEAVVVLLQYGHELGEGVGPAHIQLGDIAVQPAEDVGVVAADEEDLSFALLI
jgi:hypothetical protein